MQLNAEDAETLLHHTCEAYPGLPAGTVHASLEILGHLINSSKLSFAVHVSCFSHDGGTGQGRAQRARQVGLTWFRCRVTQDFNGEGSAAPTRKFLQCCIT